MKHKNEQGEPEEEFVEFGIFYRSSSSEYSPWWYLPLIIVFVIADIAAVAVLYSLPPEAHQMKILLSDAGAILCVVSLCLIIFRKRIFRYLNK